MLFSSLLHSSAEGQKDVKAPTLLVAQFVLTFSAAGAAFHIFTFFGAKWTATITTGDWKHLLKHELKGTEKGLKTLRSEFVLPMTENDQAKHDLGRELLMQANPMFAAAFCFKQWLQRSLLIVSDMITFLSYEAVTNMITNTGMSTFRLLWSLCLKISKPFTQMWRQLQANVDNYWKFFHQE